MPNAVIVWGDITLANVLPLSMKAAVVRWPSCMGT